MKDEKRVSELFVELKAQMTNLNELKIIEDCKSALDEVKVLLNEIWRDIRGYEGIYQVSNFGRVKSLKRCREKILKPNLCTDGYLAVTLYRNGCRKNYLVHRLVAESFLPNIENKLFVDHINGNKIDNHLENLRWATPSENQEYAISFGLIKVGCERTTAKLTADEVNYIRLNYIKGDKIFGSLALAEKFSVSKSTIIKVLSGNLYKDYGDSAQVPLLT